MTPEDLRALHRALCLPRAIEGRMLLLLRQGRLSKWFAGVGQEAVSVGVMQALRPDDWVLPLHRNLGVFTARVDLDRLYRQLLGRAGGFTAGRDRSFHFGDPARHVVGMISHLGAMLPVACGLAFEDDYDVDFDATNLTYVPFSPYRLMKAPVGGSYADITGVVSAGSVRARGCGGTFSEFVLVTTAVQNYSAELVAGYAQLQAQIASAAIGPTAAATLDSDRAVSQAAFNVADYAEAILRLDDLLDHCGVLGGPVLPNRWRSARDLDNLEGEIVAQSAHLKFLLGRLNGVP